MRRYGRILPKKQPVYTKQIQENLDDTLQKIQSQLQLYKSIKELAEDLPNDFSINKLLRDTRQEIKENITELQRTGYSIADLLGKFGAEIFKSQILTAREKIGQEEQRGKVFLTDLFSEDKFVDERAEGSIFDKQELKQYAEDIGGRETRKMTVEQIKAHPMYKTILDMAEGFKRKKIEDIEKKIENEVRVAEEMEEELPEERVEQLEEEKKQAEQEFQQVQEEKRSRGRPKKTMTKEDMDQIQKMISKSSKLTYTQLQQLIDEMKQSKPLKLKTTRSAQHIKEKQKETKKQPDIKVESEEEQSEEEKSLGSEVGRQIEGKNIYEPEPTELSQATSKVFQENDLIGISNPVIKGKSWIKEQGQTIKLSTFLTFDHTQKRELITTLGKRLDSVIKDKTGYNYLVDYNLSGQLKQSTTKEKKNYKDPLDLVKNDNLPIPLREALLTYYVMNLNTIDSRINPYNIYAEHYGHISQSIQNQLAIQSSRDEAIETYEKNKIEFTDTGSVLPGEKLKVQSTKEESKPPI